MRLFSDSLRLRLTGQWLFVVTLIATSVAAAAESPRPVVKILEGGESVTTPDACRVVVVGPGKNQPEPYPGYGGFVGWVSPIRFRNGDWLLGFSAGYWHASAPTPLRFSAATIADYQKMGLPKEIVAPTGGVAMIMRSADGGQTWSQPVDMLDTPDDDRHPAFVEPDGPDRTLICSLFTYPGADPGDYAQYPKLAHHTAVIRSFDGGRTWDKDVVRLPSPFLSDETNGPMVLLQDGSVLLTVSGTPQGGGPAQAAVFTSQDRGATWTLLSTIQADHDLDEANATQLPDGRLVMMARPEGDISWSSDAGKTWTAPVTFGMRLYAPSLYTLRDGTLACLHGSYARGGLRIIFSQDGGQTWIAPAADHGFLVDDCYGYGKAFELPDGTLLVADQGTGGHTSADAKSMSLRLLRVRIRADHSGIDLLPPTHR